MERNANICSVAVCCLAVLLSVDAAMSQEPGGYDVLKTPNGVGPGNSMPEATAPFASVPSTPTEPAAEEPEIQRPRPNRRAVGMPASSSLQITPKWSYFNLPDGTSFSGGGVQADLHLALTEAWITHLGVDETSISGGTLEGYTWDTGKLADLDADGLWGRSAVGLAVDCVHLEKLYPDQIFLSQLRGVWGYAISNNTDLGIVGIWPTVGDNYQFSTFTTGPGTGSTTGPSSGPQSQSLVKNVSLTSQLHGYVARTFGNLETVWTLGYRATPNAMVYGFDAAYPLRNNATLVTGLTANDLGALNFYLGLQLGVGVNRFTPSRMRGYFHRINRGGLFSTLTAPAALRASK